MWRLARGATPGDGSVRFEVWAPHAAGSAVHIVGGPRAGLYLLAEVGDGVYEVTIEGVGTGTDYVYRLPAGDRPDPVSRAQPDGVHGPSRVVDPHAFAWTDADWRAPAMADYVLYELHVGTFSDAGTFDGVVPHLAAVRELGITAIELMPVGEFPGKCNWGYDGVAPYAPHRAYGGPEGLRRLVDAAHRARLAVVLDVVYNHLGPEGNYLADFGPYFTDRHHTAWGPALNYDGPGSDQVRRWAIDNALYWVSEFHVDALRLDAIHAIHDTSPTHLVAELADAVHALAARLGRSVQVIAESDLNDARVVRARERGGFGADAQWADDFHHAVHTALTDERHGYYQDFSGVPALAKALRDRFVYDGRHSRFRGRHHGAPATDVPADRFVVSVQNHDQIGNRARGERLASLVSPPACRLAAALLCLAPYVPLLFMGEEWGATTPFLYFTSHGDPALADAVRRGRRAEFAAFAWADEVPDPQAEETFRRSRLDRREAAVPAHAALHRLYAALLALRHDAPALRPGAAAVRVEDDAAGRWIAVTWTARDAPPVLALFGFDGAGTACEVPNPDGRRWRLALSTEEARFGGGDSDPAPRLGARRLMVALPTPGALVFRAEPP